MCLLSAQMPNYVEDSFSDFKKGLVSLVFGKKNAMLARHSVVWCWKEMSR